MGNFKIWLVISFSMVVYNASGRHESSVADSIGGLIKAQIVLTILDNAGLKPKDSCYLMVDRRYHQFAYPVGTLGFRGIDSLERVDYFLPELLEKKFRNSRLTYFDTSTNTIPGKIHRAMILVPNKFMFQKFSKIILINQPIDGWDAIDFITRFHPGQEYGEKIKVTLILPVIMIGKEENGISLTDIYLYKFFVKKNLRAVFRGREKINAYKY